MDNSLVVCFILVGVGFETAGVIRFYMSLLAAVEIVASENRIIFFAITRLFNLMTSAIELVRWRFIRLFGLMTLYDQQQPNR